LHVSSCFMGKATFEAYGIEEMTQSPPFKLYADWPVKRLGNICDAGGGGVQTGPFGSQLHKSDYVDEGIPSIMPVNIADNRIVRDGIACITEEDAERLSKYRVQKGDIVYSRRGDVKRRSLVREAEEGWLCGTGCLRVRFGEGVVDHTFASYYLAHSDVQEWVARHAVGATMPNLNTSILSSLPFVLPPLETQKAIAHILGTLDDKIELNRRMNETLEAMAQALFKSWFVDFDPVKAKMEGRQPGGMDAETAALFPDKLVESELGLIPEGWEVGCLKDVATNIRETVKPKDLHDTVPYIGLEHMPKKSIALSQWEYADKVTSNKSRFKSGDFLFGKLRPYFHKVGIAAIDGICSTDILVVRPKDENYYSFIISYISSEEFIDYTDRLSNGAKMPRTNWKDMGKYPIPLPSAEIARCFLNVVKPLYEKIARNIYQTKELSAARDALLPKLISGEINTTELS